jgi:hypothetical protein
LAISSISASGGSRRSAGSVFRKRRKKEIIEMTRQTPMDSISRLMIYDFKVVETVKTVKIVEIVKIVKIVEIVEVV